MVSLKQSSKKIKMIWTIHDICHVLTSFSLLMFSWNKPRNFILAAYSILSINSCLLWKYLVQVWCKFQLASSQQAWYISGPLENMGTVEFYPFKFFGRYDNPHQNKGGILRPPHRLVPIQLGNVPPGMTLHILLCNELYCTC